MTDVSVVHNPFPLQSPLANAVTARSKAAAEFFLVFLYGFGIKLSPCWSFALHMA